MPMPSKSQQKRIGHQLGLDPVCQSHGCMQQQHFKTIRQLQEVIAKLESKLREYEQG